jgi:hypothetical protein
MKHRHIGGSFTYINCTLIAFSIITPASEVLKINADEYLLL